MIQYAVIQKWIGPKGIKMNWEQITEKPLDFYDALKLKEKLENNPTKDWGETPHQESIISWETLLELLKLKNK